MAAHRNYVTCVAMLVALGTTCAELHAAEQRATKTAEPFEGVLWKVDQWAKAQGSTKASADVPGDCASKQSMDVEVRYSGTGFEWFSVVPSSPIVIPGSLERVTLRVKSSDPRCGMHLAPKDGWGRGEADGKKFEWPLRVAEADRWTTVSFDVPADWVKPVSSVNRELSVESTDTFQLALDVERFGLYTLDIELKLAGHGTRTEHVNFAKLPPYRELTDAQKRASPYGINVHMGQDREMVVPFRDAGIVWFRDYGWSYDWLLRAKGADKKYAGWPYYPRIAAQFAIAGVMLMPCMMKAIGAPKEGAAPGQTVEITGWSRANAPEGKLEQYQVAIQTWDADRKKIDWHEIMMRIKWCEPMTHDWTEFRGSATISERTRTMTLIVYLRGKGTVWVDELRVVGSAATTSTSSPARAAAAAVKRRGEGTYFLHPSDTVLVVGDAISAEGGVYRLVFEDDIGTKYPGLAGAKAPKLVNAAAPGATAASVSRILPGHLDRHRPNVAVVCCGVNDSFMDVYGFATSMRAIVRTLKERSVAVTLLAPPPMNASNHPELTARSAALDQMIDQLRRLAAEEGVPLADCHATMKEHLAGGGATLDWGDGVHPNACGKRMMADALQPAWGFGEPLVE